MKVSIIAIFIILTLLLLVLIVAIWFYFSNYYPINILNKIENNLKKISKYKNEIEMYSEQFDAYSSKNSDLKKHQIDLENKIALFNKLSHNYEFDSNNVSYHLKKHNKNHKYFEIKCFFKIVKNIKKLRINILDIENNYWQTINFVEDKVIFHERIQKEITKISLIDKKININKLFDKKGYSFFAKKIDSLNYEIEKYYLYFNNDLFLKKSRKWTINKLNDLNSLLVEKLLICQKGKTYHYLLFQVIPNMFANILQTTNFEESNNNASEIKIFNKNSLTSLQNQLRLIEFSKSAEFEESIREYILDIKKSFNEIKYQNKSKEIIKTIDVKINNYLNKYKKINLILEKETLNLENLIDTNLFKKYINVVDKNNNLLGKISQYLEESNNSLINLSALKDHLINLEKVKNNQNKLKKNVDLVYYQKNMDIINYFEKTQSYWYFLISQYNKYKLSEHNAEIERIISLCADINSKLEKNNLKISNNLKSSIHKFNYFVNDFLLLINQKIVVINVVKLCISKISPLVSENEDIKELYLNLVNEYKQNNFDKCINILNSYVKNIN